MIVLADHEQAFADSAAGAAFIARRRAAHREATAYLGDRAPAWGDEDQRKAVRDGAAEAARGNLARAYAGAVTPPVIADARVAPETARAAANEAQSNAWRTPARPS